MISSLHFQDGNKSKSILNVRLGKISSNPEGNRHVFLSTGTKFKIKPLLTSSSAVKIC